MFPPTSWVLIKGLSAVSAISSTFSLEMYGYVVHDVGTP